MSRFSQEGKRLIYRYDAEQLWVEPWGPNSFRVRATQLPEMPVQDWSMLPQPDVAVDIRIVQDPRATQHVGLGSGVAKRSGDMMMATLTNGKLTCTISGSGKLTFANADGKVLLEEFVRNRKNVVKEFASALGVDAREFKPIPGGDYALTMRFESSPDEKLYGMGQYQQPFLNVKGCTMELAHRNSQASVPFCVSSEGYGFFWHNPAVGQVTFGRNVTEWKAVSTQILDYWITAGDTPAEIEEAYANVTGKVPMMPDYAMGFWQCKLRYQTQEELLGIARGYKERGLPISVIVIDFFHWPKQGDWRFDKAYWPDPQGMVNELREMGIELMVSIWPTVDKTGENFNEMLEKGYLVRVDRGLRINMDFLGNTIHFDPTNPGARAYVWNKAKQNYYDYGIKVFWLDEAEPEYTVYDFDNYRYHLGPNVRIGNLYPMMYAQTFFEGMQAEGQHNIINLLRCAWAGSQRYGALVWSGDIHSSFASLRNQFTAGLNMGLAGIPWWTTDIGGFHGGNPDDPAFRECLVRWFEYGTFCPVFRLHGDREPHSTPLGTSGGGMCNSGADNEVWSYGEENYSILKEYLFIRERMRPYITELMQAAHKKGSPVMRTLFYEFPEDSAAWDVEDAYLFGPDLLVAPIMHADCRSRQVYLPKGASWTNVWTNEVFEGGQTLAVDAPLAQIPLFTRDGRDVGIRE
jgi:alpha-D-xyloside xylohydrolase